MNIIFSTISIFDLNIHYNRYPLNIDINIGVLFSPDMGRLTADDKLTTMPFMNKLLVKKLDPAAHLPERAKEGDLGYDLFSFAEVIIPAGGLGKVRTGIAVEFPSGWGGVIKDRSSMASLHVTVTAGVIDHGYRGEIIILLSNHGDDDFNIFPGMKIAQMIPVPVTTWEVTEVDDLSETDRGDGGFGSTGAHKQDA